MQEDAAAGIHRRGVAQRGGLVLGGGLLGIDPHECSGRTTFGRATGLGGAAGAGAGRLAALQGPAHWAAERAVPRLNGRAGPGAAGGGAGLVGAAPPPALRRPGPGRSGGGAGRCSAGGAGRGRRGSAGGADGGCCGADGRRGAAGRAAPVSPAGVAGGRAGQQGTKLSGMPPRPLPWPYCLKSVFRQLFAIIRIIDPFFLTRSRVAGD